MPEGKIAPYEELADAPKLKTYMEEKLEDYNSAAGAQAIMHNSRSSRLGRRQPTLLNTLMSSIIR